MERETGMPEITEADKARAWDWLRRVAEHNEDAAVACIEWTRLAEYERRSSFKKDEFRRNVCIIIASCVLAYILLA